MMKKVLAIIFIIVFGMIILFIVSQREQEKLGEFEKSNKHIIVLNLGDFRQNLLDSVDKRQ